MRRREQKQSYQLESLEVRTMLTGNVNASMISGDSRNNAFRVRPSSSGAEIVVEGFEGTSINCLLYTSPSPQDRTRSRMPSSA